MDYIILAVLVIAAFVGIIETVKHFAHRGGCCGSGGYKMKKKRLGTVKYQRRFSVEGMKCKNCAMRVEETVDDIKGVRGRVDFKNGILTVSYEVDVDDETIISRIERLGYKVSRI